MPATRAHAAGPLAAFPISRRTKRAARGGGPSRSSAEALEQRVLLSAGDPDPTFAAGAARVTTDFGGWDGARAVFVVPGGKIVSVGVSTSSPRGEPLSDIVLARYNPDGTLDPTFGGGDGKVV